MKHQPPPAVNHSSLSKQTASFNSSCDGQEVTVICGWSMTRGPVSVTHNNWLTSCSNITSFQTGSYLYPVTFMYLWKSKGTERKQILDQANITPSHRDTGFTGDENQTARTARQLRRPRTVSVPALLSHLPALSASPSTFLTHSL